MKISEAAPSSNKNQTPVVDNSFYPSPGGRLTSRRKGKRLRLLVRKASTSKFLTTDSDGYVSRQ